MKIEVTSFICPECSTTLRIKNRSYIDRSFHCPECQTAITLIVDSHSRLHLQRDKLLTDTQQGIITANWVKLLPLLRSPAAIACSILFVIAISSLFAFLFRNRSVETVPVVETPPVVKNLVDNVVQPKQPSDKTVLKPAQPQVKHKPPVIAVIPIQSVQEMVQQEPVIAQIPQPQFPSSQPPLQPVTIDIAAKLKQKFLKFDQSVPITFEQFLFQFEELSGVPIHIDETITNAASMPLKQKFSFQLQASTLRDLLKLAVGKMNVTYNIEPTQIRILKNNIRKVGMK